MNDIITIDGYSGCLKTTLGIVLSKKLGWTFFSAGNIYRLIAIYMINNACNLHDTLDYLSHSMNIDEQGHIFVDGQMFNTDTLRSTEIEQCLSQITSIPIVITFVNDAVASLASKTPLIIDGRNLGVYVFPHAKIKVFVQSSIDTRMASWLEFRKNHQLSYTPEEYEEIRKELVARDTNDETRLFQPIECPSDAIVVDVLKDSLRTVVALLVQRFNETMQVTIPKVSVIIPMYNSEKTIIRCLQSIDYQSWPQLEIIVINDGSIDQSKQICESYICKNAELKIVDISHRGVSAARNIGLQMATGDYICFCDADDELLQSAINIMIDAFEKNTDLVVGAVIKRNAPTINEIENIEKEDAINRLFKHTPNRLLGTVWGRMYRRNVIMANPPIRFDETLLVGEDTLFVLNYLERCDKIKLIPNIVYKHYKNPDGIISSRRQKDNLSALDACYNMIVFLIEKEIFCVDIALEDLTWVYTKISEEASSLELKEEIRKKYIEIIKDSQSLLNGKIPICNDRQN